MKTRTVEFFEKKVKQIDAKIEKCFKAFEEGSEHLHRYRLKENRMDTEMETTYVGIASMVTNIERLEELRAFYIEKIEVYNPIEKAVKKAREPKMPDDKIEKYM